MRFVTTPDGGLDHAESGVLVVMCCRDRPALLAAALPTVREQLRRGDQLIVVDSASTTAEVPEVARQAGATVLREDEPGLSRARNVGWSARSEEVVLFTDDDCRPLPGWLDAAVEALSAPGVGAVWGSVLPDRDSPIPLSVGLGGLGELTSASDLSQAGHGACMAFRRTALSSIGGFDELLGAGGVFRAGEDKDALWRIHRAGWRVLAAPAMAVTHVVHRGEKEARHVMHGYGVGTGALVRKRRALGDDGPLLREELWRHGLLPALRWTKQGRYAAASGALARSGGVLRGWWATRGWEVVDGHLVQPPA